MRITIVGAGKTGVHLAHRLAADHEIVIIDQRPERVEMVRGMLPDVEAFTGDACDPAFLEHTRIADSERVVATTGDDEDNLVVAMLAKHYGVNTVYARVNHPSNQWLYDDSSGVDVAISSSEVLYGLVAKDLRVGDIVTLLKLDREGIAIDELTLPADASAVGRTLSQVQLPGSASVIAVISADGGAHIARGDTVMGAGDQLLLMCEGDSEPTGIRQALGIAEG